MKGLWSLSVLLVPLGLYACENIASRSSSSAPTVSSASSTPRSTVRVDSEVPRPAAARQIELRSNVEEMKFLAEGPRLYSMERAQELSRATGKPVVCWMGKHLFADERARRLSQELADTTIQAAMDRDGTPYDAVGPRVKFSSSNYADDAKTYFIRLDNFDKPGQAERILRASRGGGR